MFRHLSKMCVIAILFVGCKSPAIKMPDTITHYLPVFDDEPDVIESAYQQPARIVAIWSEAVYNQPGAPATRGFGGRLYFYNARSKAVPVEGQLVVYGYDDSNTNSADGIPDKKFVFTPDQLTTHYSPTELGASYSVWIPWDAVGGYKKTITLVPKFTAADGTLVIGQQSVNVLSGKMREGVKEKLTERGAFTSVPSGKPFPVRPVGYEQQSNAAAKPEAAPPADQPRMKTTTITLPQTMKRQMLENGGLVSGPVAGLTNNTRQKRTPPLFQ